MKVLRNTILTIVSMTLVSVNLFSTTLALADASLSLSPVSGTFNRGCTFSLDIKVDTGGAGTDGTDAILFYDPARFKAESITNGSIYSDYPGNNIDEANSKITVSGLASVSSAFTGSGTLASIRFTVLADAPENTASQIRFDFDPADKGKTTDSNVVERGTVADILGSATHGNYTIGTGTCGTVVTPTPVFGRGAPGDIDYEDKAPVTQDKKPLPEAGISVPTFVLGVVGGFLTIVGIIGLAML